MVVFSFFAAGLLTFAAMAVSVVFAGRLAEWIDNHVADERTVAVAKLRIYLIWLFGGIALCLGLYFGIKNLLEMLRDAM